MIIYDENTLDCPDSLAFVLGRVFLLDLSNFLSANILLYSFRVSLVKINNIVLPFFAIFMT